MSNLTKFNSSTIMMSSREIAELCDKRHDHVMRDIRNMFEVEEHSPNLGFVYKTSTYKADNGQEYTQYELDRDTTLCLVSGYNVELRMKIIKRWAELEDQIRRPISTFEMIAEMALQAAELERITSVHEERLDNQQEELQEHKETITRQEQEIQELKEELKLYRDEEQFFVAKAAAKLYGYNNISNQVAQKLGIALSRLSREMGYEIQKRKHCDFTEVGAYHIDVIRELFEIRGYEVY